MVSFVKYLICFCSFFFALSLVLLIFFMVLQTKFFGLLDVVCVFFCLLLFLSLVICVERGTWKMMIIIGRNVLAKQVFSWYNQIDQFGNNVKQWGSILSSIDILCCPGTYFPPLPSAHFLWMEDHNWFLYKKKYNSKTPTTQSFSLIWYDLTHNTNHLY